MDSELTTPPLKPPLQKTSAPRDYEPDDKDIEKLQKWHEERMLRKLRGEYESAILHLGQVVRTRSIRNSNRGAGLIISMV